jgi:hypothetical protein
MGSIFVDRKIGQMLIKPLPENQNRPTGPAIA